MINSSAGAGFSRPICVTYFLPVLFRVSPATYNLIWWGIIAKMVYAICSNAIVILLEYTIIISNLILTVLAGKVIDIALCYMLLCRHDYLTSPPPAGTG